MPPKGTDMATIYNIFFLYIEPLFAFLGACAAFFQPDKYLQLTHHPTAPKHGIPTATKIVINQLANLYLFFAINEALVLRATKDLRVWRAVITGLLIADVGHLYSLHPLGARFYWVVKAWNVLHWGNIPFVYVGALLRVCFLLSPTKMPTINLGGGGLRGEAQVTTPTRRSGRKPKPTQKVK